MPTEYLEDLRNDVQPFLIPDIFMKNRPEKEYTVRSVYLDSFQLFTYHEKLAGLRLRNKFRIRGYNNYKEDSIVFLEIKRKDSDYISKDRAPLYYHELDKFLKTKDLSLIHSLKNGSLKRKECAGNFLYYYLLNNLHPYINVVYEREAYECKFGSGLRITFDKDIRTKPAETFDKLFVDENLKPSLKKYFVMEVKFHKILPSWLPAVMKKYNVFRQSASKYVMSVDVKNDNSFVKN
jgi:SPX domain protein involved in polyphosphate accumulation